VLAQLSRRRDDQLSITGIGFDNLALRISYLTEGNDLCRGSGGPGEGNEGLLPLQRRIFVFFAAFCKNPP
jgi:hypothetical protein